MSDQLRGVLRGGAWQALTLSLPLAAIFIFLASRGGVISIDKATPLWLQMTWHPYLFDAAIIAITFVVASYNAIALFGAMIAGTGVTFFGMFARLSVLAAMLVWPSVLAPAVIFSVLIIVLVNRPKKTKTSA